MCHIENIKVRLFLNQFLIYENKMIENYIIQVLNPSFYIE